MSVAEQLERLHRLHTDGALTDIEYAAAKRALLEPTTMVEATRLEAAPKPPAAPRPAPVQPSPNDAMALSGGTRFVQWSFGLLGLAWIGTGLYMLVTVQNDRALRMSERGDLTVLGLTVAGIGATYVGATLAMNSRRPAAWWVALVLALVQLFGCTPLGVIALVLLVRQNSRRDFSRRSA